MNALIGSFAVGLSCLTVGAAFALLERQKNSAMREHMNRRISSVGVADAPISYEKIEEETEKVTVGEKVLKGVTLRQRVENFVHYDPLLPLKLLRSWRITLIVTAIVAALLTFAARVLLELWIIYLFAPLLWLFLVRRYALICEHSQNRLLFAQFPDALDVLVRSMRVGVPLAQAVDYVAHNVAEPTASRFRSISGRLSIGSTIVEALDELVRKSPLKEYRFFAVSLSLQSQTGGNVVGTLENLSRTIRMRSASQSKMKGLLSEPKMSMTILGSLPFILTTLLLVINHDYIKPLFTTTSGHHTVLLAMGLWCSGMIMMRVMIKKGMP